MSIHERKVCILHTGGTIGMVWTALGHVPREGFVQTYLDSVQATSDDRLPQWELHHLTPLLDSANMHPRDWKRIAQAILERYDDFDGFVVLHGTDTMAYTASALSFLLPGLSKPIVLTGAQLSLQDLRSDGRQHIVTSLLIAAALPVPEVCIFFSGQLLRGNRTQKVNNEDFVAYASGNYPPLATAGVQIRLEPFLVRPRGDGPPRQVALDHSPEVIALRVYPGLSPRLLRQALAHPVEGMVLETYGAGTFPSANQELLDVLDEAIGRGVVIVNCSQCHQGRVAQERYGTSVALAQRGVINGADMTPEAALTKLYCLLGRGLPVERVRQLMTRDLAGEISLPRRAADGEPTPL